MRTLLGFALCCSLVLLTGCSVSVGNVTALDRAEQRVLADHTFALDARRPPARDDLGLTGVLGHSTITVLQPPDHGEFRSRITFADGHQIDVPSDSLAVFTDGSGGPVIRIEVSSATLTDAELTQRVHASRTLGADPARIDGLLKALSAKGASDSFKQFLPLHSPTGFSTELEVIVSTLERRTLVYLVGFPPR